MPLQEDLGAARRQGLEGEVPERSVGYDAERVFSFQFRSRGSEQEIVKVLGRALEVEVPRREPAAGRGRARPRAASRRRNASTWRANSALPTGSRWRRTEIGEATEPAVTVQR